MTEKQEKILEAALDLFAKEGFRATSTSKVAKQAGVSEGLIFRHFTNKDGLLDALMRQGEERAKILMADIIMETDPRTMIKKYIELGLKMSNNKAEADFWKLQFKLKWELEHYGEHKMEPVRLALKHAFEKLEYKDPENEANHLIIILDGMAAHYFLNENFQLEAEIRFLIEKYNV